MSEISANTVARFIKPYMGKTVKNVKRGHGSSIFLEVDDLTIMIEWSWRVEVKNQIAFGSWSEEEKIETDLQLLKGQKVSDIYFQSRLPELVVAFIDSTWLCSFTTVEGNPEWALITPSRTLHSIDGRLAFE